MNILLGADPEVFVKKNGVFHSAHGLVPGSKVAPFIVDKGAVQVDGMALEFNINPASTEEEWLDNLTSVMHTLAGMVPEYQIVAESTATFTQEVMNAQPEVALELGCEPDYNAYTGKENPKPDGDVLFRTGAGHIHIGWTEGANEGDPNHLKMCRDITKALDISLGLPSVLLDKDTQRRSMYGQAGAFRPKTYGCEYRVLSNFWLRDEKLMSWVYKTVHSTIQKLKDGDAMINRHSALVQEHINNSNTIWVREYVDYLNVEMPHV